MVFVNQIPEVICYGNGSHSPFPESRRFPRTTAEEWDLVCENRWQLTLVDSLFFVGWFFGDGLFGWMADKYGRKVSFWTSVLFASACSVVSALVPWYCKHLCVGDVELLLL